MLSAILISTTAASPGVEFSCVGACSQPRAAKSRGGNALLGGHMYPGVTIPSDNVAYRWFLNRAAGGDVLVLTADDPPWDIYNPFLLNMTGVSPAPNSITTARFTARSGAADAKLATLLDGAAAIFLTGGDQSKYYTYWQGTAVSDALSSSHVVVGGSSAGLAVQGNFIFDAMHGGITSADALKYPTDSEVSLARDFIAVNEPWMRGIITDTHFLQRDRMGRLVAFVGRVAEAHWSRGDNQSYHLPGVLGVGISEHTAVLVDTHGDASFVGVGPAYFLKNGGALPTTCEEGKPLSWELPGITVWRWSNTTVDGVVFSFKTWTASPADAGARYALTVKKGTLSSTQPGGGIY